MLILVVTVKRPHSANTVLGLTATLRVNGKGRILCSLPLVPGYNNSNSKNNNQAFIQTR